MAVADEFVIYQNARALPIFAVHYEPVAQGAELARVNPVAVPSGIPRRPVVFEVTRAARGAADAKAEQRDLEKALQLSVDSFHKSEEEMQLATALELSLISSHCAETDAATHSMYESMSYCQLAAACKTMKLRSADARSVLIDRLVRAASKQLLPADYQQKTSQEPEVKLCDSNSQPTMQGHAAGIAALKPAQSAAPQGGFVAPPPANRRQLCQTAADDRIYAAEVRAALVPGMWVRARRKAADTINEGDVGTYVQTNGGSPPCQVKWRQYGGPYWVQWADVEVVGWEFPGDQIDTQAVTATANSGSTTRTNAEAAAASASLFDIQAEAVSALVSLGFDEADVVDALLQSGGDQEAAANLLLG
jgi:hypothetical protein